MNSIIGVNISAKKNESVSKTRLRLWLQLLKTSREIETDLKDRLRSGFDTTLPRFDVLAALYRFSDGLRMSELSGVLKVSNGNVTGIVDRLVEENLIVRVPVEGDRRALLVRLTADGKTQFEELAKEHESWINSILQSISQTQAKLLIEQLGTLQLSRAERGKKS